jgi:hypothetical protein
MDTLDEIINAIYNNDTSLKDSLKKKKISDSTKEKILAINNQVDIETLKNKELLEQHKSGVETFIVIKELKKTLISTLKESKSSQSIIKLMYVSTFLLGLILIGIAVYFGIEGKEILSIAFGSFGMLSIVTFLIKDPPLKLQDSRSNYAQLTSGILGWFSDLINTESMISINDTFNRKVQNTKEIDLNSQLIIHEKLLDSYLKILDAKTNNTSRLLKLIDDVAEPGNVKRKKKKKEATQEVKETQESIQKPE